jgi:hypothetical protein
VFLKKLVADVLDRVDQFPDFDVRPDYALTIDTADLTDVEGAALRAPPGAPCGAAAATLDDIDVGLDVDAAP